MGHKVTLRGHSFEARVGRLGLTERLSYDGREVSSRSPFQDRSHIFWVMEGADTVRYVVITDDQRSGTIRSVLRNGRVIYSGEVGTDAESGGALPAEQ